MTNDEVNSTDQARMGNARFQRQATDAPTNPFRRPFIILALSVLPPLAFFIHH